MAQLLGTVGEVSRGWGLKERLEGASRIGRAYTECLACTVEASRRALIMAGAAYTEERKIVLNADLLGLGREADRNSTLLHECAHIIANLRYGWNCRHGCRWSRVMALLGEPPEIAHELDYLSRKAKAIVTWVCEACGEEYHYVRMPRRRIEDCYCHTCGPERGRLRIAGDGGSPAPSLAVQLDLF